MGKLSAEEQKQLDALTAKLKAPDDAETVLLVKRGDREFTLRGEHAARALREFFGDPDPSGAPPAGKGKGRPAGPGKGTPPAPTGDGDQGDGDQGDGDAGDDDGDQGDGDEEPDPEHQRQHWYFGKN